MDGDNFIGSTTTNLIKTVSTKLLKEEQSLLFGLVMLVVAFLVRLVLYQVVLKITSQTVEALVVLPDIEACDTNSVSPPACATLSNGQKAIVTTATKVGDKVYIQNGTVVAYPKALVIIDSIIFTIIGWLLASVTAMFLSSFLNVKGLLTVNLLR